MASSSLVLGFSFWVLLISPALSLTCTSHKFTNNQYTHCLDLPTLNSFLHFTYYSSNRTLSVAFVAAPEKSDGWIAWALNPTGTGMAGAQALVAYKDTKGLMTVSTYNISSYESIVKSKKLSFDVWDTRADESGGMMRIFGKIKVPKELATAGKINQIWQVGPSVSGDGLLAKHQFVPANLNAKGSLDLGGATNSGSGADPRIKKRNIHGILNAVSWGILFPIGVIIARYLRTFESADPVWFYLHIFCQVSAYAIGVAGWATGLQLGSQSKAITFTTHRNLGIALFSLATVQVLALLLRPRKDHKYRFYWNIYHHSVGYAILVLGILNVFKGLDILKPLSKWKSAYTITIIVLGGIAVLLEVITWIVVIVKKRRSAKSTKPLYNNGAKKAEDTLKREGKSSNLASEEEVRSLRADMGQLMTIIGMPSSEEGVQMSLNEKMDIMMKQVNSVYAFIDEFKRGQWKGAPTRDATTVAEQFDNQNEGQENAHEKKCRWGVTTRRIK